MIGWPLENGHTFLAIALVVIAGCAGIAPGPAASSPTPTVKPLPTVDSPVETTRCHCIQSGRFELHHLYDGPVAVRILETTGGANRVIADGRFSTYRDNVNFDPVLRYGADYRIEVLVDGEFAWNETVS